MEMMIQRVDSPEGTSSMDQDISDSDGRILRIRVK